MGGIGNILPVLQPCVVFGTCTARNGCGRNHKVDLGVSVCGRGGVGGPSLLELRFVSFSRNCANRENNTLVGRVKGVVTTR